ncbi:hypothetical protein [Methanosarcina sp. MTP4]|uniref:hypothetical protein n=1 Tax=Methanosarcina sp. MTP4 TaxID=1434100 RepID=UPI000ABEBC90|nr:hypothetical protein [Methanosarcina sp. MTP4]
MFLLDLLSKGGILIKKIRFAVPLALLLALLVSIPGASASSVDVKPASWPNSINVCNNGVIPVAFACPYRGLTAEDLINDTCKIQVAIKVENESGWDVEFCENFSSDDLKLNIEDVTSYVSYVVDRGDPDYCPDGYPDLTMKFRTHDIFGGINPADYEEGKAIEFEMWGYDCDDNLLFNSFDRIRFVPANCDKVDNPMKLKHEKLKMRS